jgi:hypothetical protein
MLLQGAQRDAGDEDPVLGGPDLEAFESEVGVGILPAPQEEVLGPTEGVLSEPFAGTVPATLKAVHLMVEGVAHREEREAAPLGLDDLDLEPLADRDRMGGAVGEVEHVLRHRRADAVTGWLGGGEQAMGDDDVPRALADVEGNGLARDEEAVTLLVVGADEEREPAEFDASPSGQRSVCLGRENVGASVAEILEVEGFVARVTRHGPIVAPSSPLVFYLAHRPARRTSGPR